MKARGAQAIAVTILLAACLSRRASADDYAWLCNVNGTNQSSPCTATTNGMLIKQGATYLEGISPASVTGVGTCLALAANGGNCSAGSYPLGVDAAGAAESCTVVQYQTIEDEESGVAQRTILNFEGAGVTCADEGGVQTTCTIPGGAGSNALLDGTAHTDTTASAVTRGDIIYGNATPAWDDLAIGANRTALMSDGTDPAWEAIDLGADTTGNYAGSASEGGAATTATALAANGANCSAGSYPLGVDASGAVESCTTIISGVKVMLGLPIVGTIATVAPSTTHTDITQPIYITTAPASNSHLMFLWGCSPSGGAGTANWELWNATEAEQILTGSGVCPFASTTAVDATGGAANLPPAATASLVLRVWFSAANTGTIAVKPVTWEYGQ